MALKATDVFIVQQSSGAQALGKVSAYEIAEYVDSAGGINYKGTADMTDTWGEPAFKNIGDMWRHSGDAGDFAWTIEPGTSPQFVLANNAQAIWNGSWWDVDEIQVGDLGVSKIEGTAPIVINDLNPAEPIISVNNATQVLPGVVTLATQADIDGSASNKVITADQLATVIAEVEAIDTEIDNLGGGTVTSVTSAAPGDPITVSTPTTTPVIAIKDSTTVQKGVVTLATADDVTNSHQTHVVTAKLLKDESIQLSADITTQNNNIQTVQNNLDAAVATLNGEIARLDGEIAALQSSLDNLSIDGGVYAS